MPITESAVEYLVGITAEWTAQQLREAFPFDQVPRYLLRDRDGIFVVSFTRTWKRWPGRVGGVIGETQASPTGHLEALDSVRILGKTNGSIECGIPAQHRDSRIRAQ